MGKENKITLCFLWQIAQKKKIYLVLLLLIQILLGISNVSFACFFRGIIDGAVEKNMHHFVYYMISIIIMTLIQISLIILNKFLIEFTKSSLENAFKIRLFETLLIRDYASVTSVHSGEWINRLTSDTTIVADGLATILPNIGGMVTILICALTTLLVLVPQITYILIPTGCILMGLSYFGRKIIKKRHKAVQESDGKVRMFLQECLNSLLVIKTFSKENQMVNVATNKMNDHHTERMKKNYFSNMCNLGFGMMMKGLYLVGAIYCAYGIFQGRISYGTFTAVIQLIGQIQSPFANITAYFPKYYAMLASGERLMEAENYKVDKSITRPNFDFTKIGLNDACFSYESTTTPKLIQNLNLQINKGEYLAIVGKSGSGKSTVFKLLMCLYSLDSGERYIQNGNETTELTANDRGLFAYVPQGNQLMSGTIREIVSFLDKEKVNNDTLIRETLQIACAEFVFDLKDGMDTMIGERGHGLSEGQMQRLALARAICTDSPILMLDESTSALDELTEKRLLENLRTMTEKTLLIVTHRRAALDICDRVIQLDGE